jgi:hypothetical protein
MGSEKSPTQAGYEKTWGVGDKNRGGRVGVYACRGIIDEGMVMVSTGTLTGCGVERSFPIPHARIVTIAPVQKNKGFTNFIFFFRSASHTFTRRFPEKQDIYKFLVWQDLLSNFVNNKKPRHIISVFCYSIK